MGTSDSERNERAAFLRFVRKAALFLPVFLLLPAINYFVDPRNVFSRGKHETEMGRELALGHNVANFDQFDARLLNRAFVAQVRYRPDVVVLGTSRTLNFRSELFPGKRVLNSGVLSGTLPDLLGLYEQIRQRGLQPSLVVLGIDPWMLNADAFDPRTASLADLIDSMETRLGVKVYKPVSIVQKDKLETLFSLGDFQEAILQLMSRRTRPKWYLTPTAVNNNYTRLPDGSFTYPAESVIDSVAVMRRAVKYAQKPVFQIAENTKISAKNLEAIDRLVEQIRKDGAEVWLYLPPYHPYVYDQLAEQPEYHFIDSAEAAIRELARNKDIFVLGSFNPHKYGLAGKDFHDGHHLRQAGISRIFSADTDSIVSADKVRK